MRKVVLFMMLVLSLFLKAFEARLESADLSNIEISHPEEIPVQGVSQIDLFKRFFLVNSTGCYGECMYERDSDRAEQIKNLKADATVLIDSETADTIRIGDPFFIVSDGSKIVKGTFVGFLSSCRRGCIGLLRLKEKIDWYILGNVRPLAFAQKKPSPDILGSVTHLDEKSARKYLPIIKPKIPKHYGDVVISAVIIVPPKSPEKYFLVTADFFETKQDYETGGYRFGNHRFSGFLFRQRGKEIVLLEQVPGLVDINGITDLDRDGIYEVLVRLQSNDKFPEMRTQIQLFNGKAIVQEEPQLDLLKRFLLVSSPECHFECDFELEEQIQKLSTDAIVSIDSEIADTIRVGDPFFIVNDGSKIVEGRLIKFLSSYEFGRVGLLQLKEKIVDDFSLLAFAQKKPSPDILGSVTYLDEQSERQYLSLIEPHMPKYYGDLLSINAVRFVPPKSPEEYLLVSVQFFETEEDFKNDEIKSSNTSGFLFRRGDKGMVLLEQVSGLEGISNITDLDRDGIYEVLVTIGFGLSATLEMRLFDGKFLSESKRVMAEWGD